MDDWSLLQSYVRDGSRQAMDELVRRHLAMVYGAALRQVRDEHLAHDVTQAVFLVLMRSAPRISRRVVLGGWLFNTTRFTAKQALRSERRRLEHERGAAAMKCEHALPDADAPSDALGRHLNDALASLPRADRDAVVMKYLQGKSHGDVAAALHMTENTARQRLFRARSKLRALLTRKGLTLSDDELGGLLMIAGLRLPPPHLAHSISNALHAPVAAGSSGVIASAVLRSLIMAQIKTTALVSAALLLVAAAGIVAIGQSAGNAPAPNHAAAAAEPTDTVGPSNTPNGTLVGAFNAFNSGNADALIACFQPLPPDQEASLRRMADCIHDVDAFQLALTARFGDAAAQSFIRDLGIMPPVSVDTMASVQPVISGDTAQIKLPRLGVIKFVRQGDLWELGLDVLPSFRSFINYADSLNKSLPALEVITAKIRDGKYQTVQDARLDIEPLFAQLQNGARNQRATYDPPLRPASLGPGRTPQETVASLFWADSAGDQDAAIACYLDPSPEIQTRIRNVVAVSHAAAALRASITKKFNATVAQNSLLWLGIASPITKSTLAAAAVDSAADVCTIDVGGGIGKINLLKSNGVWKIDPQLFGSPNRPWQNRLQDYYLPRFAALASAVAAGKYHSAKELQADVQVLQKQIMDDYKRMTPPKPQAAAHGSAK